MSAWTKSSRRLANEGGFALAVVLLILAVILLLGITPDTSWADPTSLHSWHYDPSWAYSGSNGAGYGNYVVGNAANLDGAGRTFTSSGSTHAAGGALMNASLTNTAPDPHLMGAPVS